MATLRDISHYTTISTSEQPLSSTTEIVTGESESESSYVILVSVAIIPRQPLSSVLCVLWWWLRRLLAQPRAMTSMGSCVG